MREDHPSQYKASVLLTYQQMWEIRKALVARLAVFLHEDDGINVHAEQIRWLYEAGKALDEHIDRAVEQRENRIVLEETRDSLTSENIHRWLTGE